MTSGVTDTPRPGPPPAAGELAWHTLSADQVLHSEGVDAQRGLSSAETAARAEARLAVAVTRGLLLDLLATGDRDAATEAFERYLHHAGPDVLTAGQSGQASSPRP